MIFSQPWYAFFVKNSLAFMMTQQVNSREYTEMNQLLSVQNCQRSP